MARILQNSCHSTLPKNFETPSEVIRSAYPTSSEVAVLVQQIAPGVTAHDKGSRRSGTRSKADGEGAMEDRIVEKEFLRPSLIRLALHFRSQKLYPTMRRNLGAGPEYKLVFSSANMPRLDCIPTRTLKPVS